jgi:multidrug efflux system outer membrane protein
VKPFGEEHPWPPGNKVKDSRETISAGGATGQNDGLEGIQQHCKQANNAGNQSNESHHFSFAYSSRSAKATQPTDSILADFGDVSNALIALNKQRAYREQQEMLVEAAKDATRLARLRYQGGSTGYLEVLTTDSNLNAVQLNLVNAQQGEALALVQLYGALGGGWQA